MAGILELVEHLAGRLQCQPPRAPRFKLQSILRLYPAGEVPHTHPHACRLKLSLLTPQNHFSKFTRIYWRSYEIKFYTNWRLTQAITLVWSVNPGRRILSIARGRATKINNGKRRDEADLKNWEGRHNFISNSNQPLTQYYKITYVFRSY